MRLSSLVILLCLILFGCQKVNYVIDKESLFSPEQIDKLNELIAGHEKETSNEISIVSTPDWEGHIDIKDYSVEFFNTRGIGKAELNNGVLITISRINRTTRITTGYGLENILTDSIAKGIIDDIMIPHFRKGEFFEGAYSGSQAIIEFLEQPENRLKH